MPKFYLQSTDNDGSVTTHSFESEWLTDVVDHVEDFLLGSGFAFDGLELVQDKLIEETQIKSKKSIKEVVNTTPSIFRKAH
tara:strand:+ start:444 stop:686 length:243 start_codon:yes stop_codon:yes gene_type:complete